MAVVMRSMLSAVVLAVVATVAGASEDDPVRDFLAVLKDYNAKKYTLLRDRLVSGDERIVERLSKALQENRTQPVEGEVASILAEMPCAMAASALRGAVLDESGRVRWTVAGALTQRKDSGELGPAVREALAQSIPRADDIQVLTAVDLLAREPGSCGAGLLVPVLERLRMASEPVADERLGEFLESSMKIVVRVSKILSTKQDILKAATDYGGRFSDSPRWKQSGAYWVLYIRCNQRDLTAGPELLRAVQDSALPASTRAMFISRVASVCGESGRAALEKLAAPFEAALRDRSYSPAVHGEAKPEWIMGREAHLALKELDRSKPSTPKAKEGR